MSTRGHSRRWRAIIALLLLWVLAAADATDAQGQSGYWDKYYPLQKPDAAPKTDARPKPKPKPKSPAPISTEKAAGTKSESVSPGDSGQPAAARSIVPAAGRGAITLPLAGAAADAATKPLYSKSYALVIGQNAYPKGGGWSALTKAVPDAEAVARHLKEVHGFDEVDLRRNLTFDELDRALKAFFYEKGDDKEARLVLWYAGHGHTLETPVEEGYLVPVDAPAGTAGAQFRSRAIAMSTFEHLMMQAHAKHVLMVFDACFAANIFNIRTRDAAPQLPPAITVATGGKVRQLISSGGKGQVVADNGLFRDVFLAALDGREPLADANRDGFITGAELGLYLQDRVTNLTAKHAKPQSPLYGKLNRLGFDTGDVVFQAGGRQLAAVAVPPVAPQPPPQPTAESTPKAAQIPPPAHVAPPPAAVSPAPPPAAAAQTASAGTPPVSSAKPWAAEVAPKEAEPAAPITPPVAASAAPADAKQLVREMQEGLKRAGCFSPEPTGTWGNVTKKAARNFNTKATTKIEVEKPTPEAWAVLKGVTARVCPMECPDLEMEQDGACVPKVCPEGEVLDDGGSCLPLPSEAKDCITFFRDLKSAQTSPPQLLAGERSVLIDAGYKLPTGISRSLATLLQKNGIKTGRNEGFQDVGCGKYRYKAVVSFQTDGSGWIFQNPRGSITVKLERLHWAGREVSDFGINWFDVRNTRTRYTYQWDESSLQVPSHAVLRDIEVECPEVNACNLTDPKAEWAIASYLANAISDLIK